MRLASSAQAETGETETEQCERAGFWNGGSANCKRREIARDGVKRAYAGESVRRENETRTSSKCTGTEKARRDVASQRIKSHQAARLTRSE